MGASVVEGFVGTFVTGILLPFNTFLVGRLVGAVVVSVGPVVGPDVSPTVGFAVGPAVGSWVVPLVGLQLAAGALIGPVETQILVPGKLVPVAKTVSAPLKIVVPLKKTAPLSMLIKSEKTKQTSVDEVYGPRANPLAKLLLKIVRRGVRD